MSYDFVIPYWKSADLYLQVRREHGDARVFDRPVEGEGTSGRENGCRLRIRRKVGAMHSVDLQKYGMCSVRM